METNRIIFLLFATFLVFMMRISTASAMVDGLYCGKENCYDGASFVKM